MKVILIILTLNGGHYLHRGSFDSMEACDKVGPTVVPQRGYICLEMRESELQELERLSTYYRWKNYEIQRQR